MSKQISKLKNLQIANICYANVAGLFATFQNHKYRGPNFTWEWFIEHCEIHSAGWMLISDVRGDREIINSTAKQFAKEISRTLVERMR